VPENPKTTFDKTKTQKGKRGKTGQSFPGAWHGIGEASENVNPETAYTQKRRRGGHRLNEKKRRDRQQKEPR